MQYCFKIQKKEQYKVKKVFLVMIRFIKIVKINGGRNVKISF